MAARYSELSQPERAKLRAAYVEQQGGKCHHCGRSLSESSGDRRRVSSYLFPRNFFKWPVHLHHDHESDLTIGAVHAHCNAVLWQYYGE